jgi:hypothetical protein
MPNLVALRQVPAQIGARWTIADGIRPQTDIKSNLNRLVRSPLSSSFPQPEGSWAAASGRGWCYRLSVGTA